MTDLRKLHEAATPGPWTRETVGHAGLAEIVNKIDHALATPLPDGTPPNTDATWIVNPDGTLTVAFVGNGPRQTDNGELIAATRNALPFLLDVVEKARAIQFDPDDGQCIDLKAALDALDAHLRGE